MRHPYDPEYYFFDGHPDPLNRTNTYYQRAIIHDMPSLTGLDTLSALGSDLFTNPDSCEYLE